MCVYLGAIADILLEPYIAIILGLIGGVVATCGFIFLPEIMTRKFRIHDTCGVHSLHAIPGTIGGIASALYASLVTISRRSERDGFRVYSAI